MAVAVRRTRPVAEATRLLRYNQSVSLSYHEQQPAASSCIGGAVNTSRQSLSSDRTSGSSLSVTSGGDGGHILGNLLSCMHGLRTLGSGRAGSLDHYYYQRRLFEGVRTISTATGSSVSDGQSMASEVIGYAVTNRKNVGTQVEVSRVLEQGYKFLLSQGPSTANSAARVLLTLASIHVDGGRLQDALDVLEQVSTLEGASADIHVSSSQALVAVLLRCHKDEDALTEAKSLKDFVNKAEGLSLEESVDLNFRSVATIQFAEHTTGSKTSGGLLGMNDLSSFSVFDDKKVKVGSVAALFGLAECAHIRGHFSRAKEFYERCSVYAKNYLAEPLETGAGLMSAEDVLVGAGAGLGQVAAHLGDFDEAEKELTKALNDAEQINGSTHPRVGAVLACLAEVYAQRGIARKTGDLLLAEGLFRKATDLLGAPPLDQPVGSNIDMSDAIAITRARYAVLLSKTKSRESEAQRLRAWATSAWKGARSLEDVLVQDASTQPPAQSADKGAALEDAYIGRYVVLDVRLGRVLYSPSNL